MIFNTNIQPERAYKYLDELKAQGAVVEIKSVKQTRSSLQNRSLHLFFIMAAKELNDMGIAYVYNDLISGEDVETMWTPELFKKQTWAKLQMAMYGTTSTTKLKRNEIDPIFETINKFFAERGVQINFPNQFDYYLSFYGKSNEKSIV